MEDRMENRALGKGLSALIPEKFNVSNKPEVVSYIATDRIKDNTLQPRINYDDPKMAELTASIKEQGILQPILVREKSDYFEVIAGERRLRAARSLKLDSIPVVIKNVSDQEALVIALIENVQREDLNPIEEAQAYRRLINEFNYTQDFVAKSVGKDRSTISNLLRLLKLPEEIQTSVFNGILSFGHARALLGIENNADQKHYFLYTIEKQLSVRELENIIRGGIKNNSPRVRKKDVTKDNDIAAVEENLQRALGTKVRIAAQKKRGKIIIEYYSWGDLERILGVIKK